MIELDIIKFREQIPKFKNIDDFSDSYIQAKFDISILYISNNVGSCLSYNQREHLIYLFIAHLILIEEMLENDEDVDLITSSTVGSESSSFLPPATAGEPFEIWLASTGYGTQVSAILKSSASGGIVVRKTNFQGL